MVPLRHSTMRIGRAIATLVLLLAIHAPVVGAESVAQAVSKAAAKCENVSALNHDAMRDKFSAIMELSKIVETEQLDDESTVKVIKALASDYRPLSSGEDIAAFEIAKQKMLKRIVEDNKNHPAVINQVVVLINDDTSSRNIRIYGKKLLQSSDIESHYLDRIKPVPAVIEDDKAVIRLQP